MATPHIQDVALRIHVELCGEFTDNPRLPYCNMITLARQLVNVALENLKMRLKPDNALGNLTVPQNFGL